ncbi:hypothetical protein QEH56_21095, partial [Pelagicoccus enzymogenes]|uniref:hypothetical protein n=1 Tax=Pelagicoccus enzymogenes TaxID=2773457 RepID=UPI00280F9C1A
YSLRQVYQMCKNGEIDHRAEFYSESSRRWRRLPEYMEEEFPTWRKLDMLKRDGFQYVRFVGSPEGDCPACTKLASQTFFIDRPPMIPPEDCCCNPWCQLIARPVETQPE